MRNCPSEKGVDQNSLRMSAKCIVLDILICCSHRGPTNGAALAIATRVPGGPNTTSQPECRPLSAAKESEMMNRCTVRSREMDAITRSIAIEHTSTLNSFKSISISSKRFRALRSMTIATMNKTWPTGNLHSCAPSRRPIVSHLGVFLPPMQPVCLILDSVRLVRTRFSFGRFLPIMSNDCWMRATRHRK